MKPENVNPSNFKVEYILFDNEEFSIAYGKWEGKDYSIAMRWNGNENDPGYPQLFGNPVWFLITNDLKIPIIKSLLEVDNANSDLILKALENEFR
jgi:hypothetical protein